MKRAAQLTLAGLVLLLAAGIIAPQFNAGRYRGRIQSALEAALERKVEIGEVRLNLLTGPGFTVRNVYIHEDPKIGLEPIAYVGTLVAFPRLWSLWTGHLSFSSLRLEDAELNLSRTQPEAGQYRWNIESLLRPSLVAAFPNLSIRDGRINFKAENLKSVVYLLNADLDITPPASAQDPWRFRFEGKPARTDRPARGSGVFTSRGTWTPATGKLDLDLSLDRSEMSDIVALVRGEDIGLHGFVSGKAHLDGPPEALAIHGRLNVLDVHGWDQSIPQGDNWPLDMVGTWNVRGQQLKLEAGVANKVSIRYLVERYFTQPRWGVNISFKDFGVEPLVALARHLGIALPPGMKVTGKLDGVIGYAGTLEGQTTFHNVALSLPGTLPVTFETAQVVITQHVARLLPAHAVFGNKEEAEIEAAYLIGAPAANVTIATEGLSVKAIPGVPLLSGLTDGTLRGQLRFTDNQWNGNVSLANASVAMAAFAEPVAMEAADLHIEGPRVSLQHIRGNAGGIAFTGDYRYEPGAPRPHRFHVMAAEADMAALEKLASPALAHKGGLFGLGKPVPPEWLKQLRADGTLQVGALTAGTVELHDVRSRVLWDGARIALPDLTAAWGQGTLTSRVLIDVTGRTPVYEAVTKLLNVPWKTGKMDAETTLQTSGMGMETLTHLQSTGSFAGHGVVEDYPVVTGRYDLKWSLTAPRLNVTDLRLSGAGEVVTGKGSLQNDGTLLVQVANGTRQLRLPLQ